MYYVTFASQAEYYTVLVRARSAKHAIRMTIKGKRSLVCVTLSPPATGSFIVGPLGQYA